MRPVPLYTRPGCCLCDEAREVIDRVRDRHAFALDVVDIEGDDVLHRRYLERIPVITLGNEELFDFFVDEEALRRKL